MGRIREVKDVEWPFHGDPCVHGSFGQREVYEKVDPFPGYPHDMRMLRDVVKRVETAFPLKFKPVYLVLHHEVLSRTNGWSSIEEDWECDERDDLKRRIKWTPVIVLSGKRIPIMPAMTRYLVAHEYGHAVQHTLERAAGLSGEDFLKDYAKERGCVYNDAYGGANWATNTGEVFANDFRILVCNMEIEFWPHSVTHPLKLKRIKRWWAYQARRTKGDTK